MKPAKRSLVQSKVSLVKNFFLASFIPGIPFVLLLFYFTVYGANKMGSLEMIGVIGLYLFLHVYLLWWMSFSAASGFLTFLFYLQHRKISRTHYLLLGFLVFIFVWSAAANGLIPSSLWGLVEALLNWIIKK